MKSLIFDKIAPVPLNCPLNCPGCVAFIFVAAVSVLGQTRPAVHDGWYMSTQNPPIISEEQTDAVDRFIKDGITLRELERIIGPAWIELRKGVKRSFYPSFYRECIYV